MSHLFSHFNPILNAFIEDTCVLIVIAYLLARGRLLGLLFPERPDRRQEVSLGVALGLVGISEVIFPGARAPYVTHTLIVTFGVLIGGLRAGLIAAGIVAVSVWILAPSSIAMETMLALATSALIAEGVRRLFGHRNALLRGLVAGIASQAGVICAQRLWIGELHVAHALSYALVSIPANGFGVLLLQLILNDGRTRADSDRHRLEAERAHTLVTEAQLSALRARVHPHFLYNALTSIAALCGIDPEKAESATVLLSQQMRRSLESNAAAQVCLTEEIDYVRGYLEIEQYRLGDRMQVGWQLMADCRQVMVPAFALQTLVENAVAHGLAPKMEAGRLRIIVRARARHIIIAVIDDGVGMSAETRANALRENRERLHGLQIQNQQLTLLYGRGARVRLWSRPDAGTLAAFAIPHKSHAGQKEITDYAYRTDRG